MFLLIPYMCSEFIIIVLELKTHVGAKICLAACCPAFRDQPEQITVTGGRYTNNSGGIQICTNILEK